MALGHRQAPIGRRSEHMLSSEEQRKLAMAGKTREAARRNAPIYAEIVPAGTFTLAEDYHQKYYLRGDSTLMAELSAIYPRDADFIASTAAARLNGFLGGHGGAERLREDLPRLGLSEAGQRHLLDLAKALPSPQCQ